MQQEEQEGSGRRDSPPQGKKFAHTLLTILPKSYADMAVALAAEPQSRRISHEP
jgi:hypothetical protein